MWALTPLPAILLLLSAITIIDAGDSGFRSRLFATVYDKAALRLSSQDAFKLLGAMRPLDDDYMNAKAENRGLDKPKKALRSLLEEYRCSDIFDALDGGKESVNVDGGTASDASTSEPAFYDPRVKRIWTEAVSSGKFAKKELDALYEELSHYDKKALELHRKHNETVGRENRLSDTDDNTIPSDLKYEKRYLNHKLQQIEDNVIVSQFKSDKTKELWKKARTSFMGKEELELLQEELSHFDRSMEKLAYFSTRAKDLDEKAPDAKHVYDKLASLEKKVDKHEKSFKSRFIHTEL